MNVEVKLASHILKVALVGNPNCGKTTLFNSLTGLRQKTANYPGVTVDKKTGSFKTFEGGTVKITDLPGTYSLYPRSEDEIVTYNILIDKDNPDHPDVVIVVLDASNFKRNLLFATQIIDLKIPVIIALNMQDIAAKKGLRPDAQLLSRQLDIPVVSINARNQDGIDELKKTLDREVHLSSKHFFNIAPFEVEAFENFAIITGSKNNYKNLHLAIHHIKNPNLDVKKSTALKGVTDLFQLKLSALQGSEILERYKVIDSIIKEHQPEQKDVEIDSLTQKLDNVLTHQVWGYPIFLGMLFIMFQAIFTIAEYPMMWIEQLFAITTSASHTFLPAGWVTDLFVDGILAGLGGIVIFIPQIALLFGFITILEDTGYMARISFIMDNMMKKVGLNGKSIVPLMSGMACAVPAIMATRTIEDWKDRLITIMVTPLMSCAARLPVYTLLIAFFVPSEFLFGFLNLQALVLLGMYIVGVVAALSVALVLKLILKATSKSFFILELPDYKSPRWSNIVYTMFEKSKIFVVQAGKIIIVISIILWALSSYGPGNAIEEAELAVIENSTLQQEYSEQDLAHLVESEKIKASYAGYLGKAIEPVIAPLGFDWKIGIALITSFAAREVFVGTMSTLYSLGSDSEDITSLKEKMMRDMHPITGSPIYSMATALSLMIFYAFAMQCMSTVAIVKRETQSWKWPLIQVLYMTLLAYSASFVVYNLLA